MHSAKFAAREETRHLVRLWIGALIVWVGSACSESEMLWQEDLVFSEALTVLADTYRAANGVSAAAHVDAVAIYILDEEGEPHPHLAELRRRAPAMESRDPATIRRLLEAAAVKADGPDACRGELARERYYVAAFDHTLMRVGSFRSGVCETLDGGFATVRPTGNAGIYLSSELADVFDELMLGSR